jgi:hypothetical protein
MKAFQSLWDLFAIFSLPFERELSRYGKCRLSTLGGVGWKPAEQDTPCTPRVAGLNEILRRPPSALWAT